MGSRCITDIRTLREVWRYYSRAVLKKQVLFCRSLLQISPWGAGKFLTEDPVEGLHGGKAAFRGAVGDIVLPFTHQQDRVFQLYSSEILHRRDAAAIFEIPGQVTPVVAEVLGNGAGGNAAVKMVMDIKEDLGGEVPVHRLIRCFEGAVFRNEPPGLHRCIPAAALPVRLPEKSWGQMSFRIKQPLRNFAGKKQKWG